MPAERRRLAVDVSVTKRRGRDEMIKTSIELQELRKRIDLKAKADKAWRLTASGFWLEEVE
jgi:hypothetical protein